MVFKKVIIFSLAGIISVSQAYACSLPNNWSTISDSPTKSVEDKIAIITATVKSLEAKQYKNKVCIDIEYSDVKLLLGKAKPPYKAAWCLNEETDIAEAIGILNKPQDPGIVDFMGMFEGAKILSYLTKQKLNKNAEKYLKPPKGSFRFMIIDCWGSHFNNGNHDKKELNAYLDKLVTDSEKYWFKK